MSKSPRRFYKNTPRTHTHNRKCVKCSKPCWPNYYYCKPCHSVIGNAVAEDQNLRPSRTPKKWGVL